MKRVIVTVGASVGILLTLCAGFLTLGTQAGATPSPTLTVSPTGANSGSCQTTACKTISYAVAQAPAGATINVGPGTYAEQLIITKALTINGSGAGSTIIDPTSLVADTDTDSATAQYAIIDTKGTPGVHLSGLGVNGAAALSFIDGFGCASDYVGIYFHNASGSIANTAVTNIELEPSLFGCQSGQGVYVDSASGSSSNVTMSGLVVTSYDKNGITCDDVGTYCSITGSVVTGIGPTALIAQNGIQDVWGSTSIQNDTVTNNSYSGPNGPAAATGILIFDAGPQVINQNVIANNDVNIFAGEDSGLASGEPIADPPTGVWTITTNIVANAVNHGPYPFGDGYGDGIQIVNTANPVNVVGNTVNGAAEFGIGLYGATNASIWENAINGAGDGIYVGGPGYASTDSSHDAITADAISNSAVDGILADVDSSFDVFTLNFAAADHHNDFVNLGTNNTFLADVGEPVVLAGPIAGVVLLLAHLTLAL
jgi:hypothetical protein